MALEITIHTDNDATRKGYDLAELLRQTASALELVDDAEHTEATGRIRDYNGNTAGSWTISAAAPRSR